ncbi:MAG: hypothetical protein MK008_02155 [Bdellovibrionales bacterium]|nr:hypothetical protein [Bdellovibrionales bacterium]
MTVFIISFLFSGILFAQNTLSIEELKALEPAKKAEISEKLGVSNLIGAEALYEQVVQQLISSLYIDFKSTIRRLETNYLKKANENSLILYEKNFTDFCHSKDIKSKEILKYQVLSSSNQASAYYSICSQPSVFKESIQLTDSSVSAKDYLLQGNKSLSVDVSRVHVFSGNQQFFGYKVIANENINRFVVFDSQGESFISVELDNRSKLLQLSIKKMSKTRFSIGDFNYGSNYKGADIKLVANYSNTTPEFMVYHGSQMSYISRLDFSVFLNAYFIQSLSVTYSYVFKILEMLLPQASEAIIQQNNKKLIEDFIVLINKVKQGSDTNFVTNKLEQLLQSAKEGKILDQRDSD